MHRINTGIFGGVTVSVMVLIAILKKKKRLFPENTDSIKVVDSIENQTKETQSSETVEEHVYSKMSVKELRRIASIQKVKNYSKLKKDELLRSLQFYTSHSE